MSIKKFLGIAFMCHQRPDRSFFIRGKQFPLCARCTGILIGYFLGIFTAICTGCSNYCFYLILLLPMVIDGVLQLKFKKESNNIRRVITGILGGIGIIYLFVCVHMFTCRLVRELLSCMGII